MEWRDVTAAEAAGDAGPWDAASATCWRLHALAPQPPALRSIFALQVKAGHKTSIDPCACTETRRGDRKTSMCVQPNIDNELLHAAQVTLHPLC